MGRPINKKFFGNLNRPYDNEQTGGNSGVGGESVVSTITVSNSGTRYSQGTTVAIGAPNIAGGIPAAISYSINSAGNITVALTEGGTGYTSAPNITVTKASTVNTVGTATNASFTLTNLTSVAGIVIGMLADAGHGMQSQNYVASVGANSVTLTKTMSLSTSSLALTFSDAGASFSASTALSSNTQNAIAFKSYLLAKDGGSSAITGGDILKQEASRRYLVKNTQGKGQCILATSDTLAAGQMNIIATDWSGATYWVKKLTARKATLVNRTSTSTALATTAKGLTTGWTLGAATGTAVGSVIVSIASN